MENAISLCQGGELHNVRERAILNQLYNLQMVYDSTDLSTTTIYTGLSNFIRSLRAGGFRLAKVSDLMNEA